MENVMQQLVSYAEQLIPRGMDFLLSIAVGIPVSYTHLTLPTKA